MIYRKYAPEYHSGGVLTPQGPAIQFGGGVVQELQPSRCATDERGTQLSVTPLATA